MLDIDLNVAPSIGSEAIIRGESKSDGELGLEPMRRDDQNLQLLIEAARYVEEYENKKLSLKRCRELGQLGQLSESTRVEKLFRDGNSVSQLGYEVEEREAELVGRVETTKRGRARVLPNKYRDSVMEPLSRLDRSDPVPPKRRSR